MLKKKQENKGITLISLVVAIVVLLILAGISISMLTGDNGILTRAQDAKEKTEQAEKEEKTNLAQTEDLINEYVGIDWDTVLANAKKHPDQVTSTAIGVGTDGKSVNMDLWDYTLLDDGTYCLNSINNLSETWVTGYKGTIIDGSIEGNIPTYISSDEGKTWKEVSKLFMTFYNLENLTDMPKLPHTLKKGEYTFFNCKQLKNVENLPAHIKSLEGFFYGCESLSKFPTIPNEVEDLTSTFYNCKNLISSPIIPESVKIMHCTFAGCSKLTIAPNIPQHVEDMAQTFSDCITLKTAPEIIPESVTNLSRTFQGCSNLTGIITINASVKGLNITETENDYSKTFYNAVTNEECKVQLIGTCSILQNIVDESNNSNISLLNKDD